MPDAAPDTSLLAATTRLLLATTRLRVRLEEETHTYFVQDAEGGTETAATINASSLATSVFPLFDAKKALATMHPLGRQRKYFGKKDADILQQWEHDRKAAAEKGSVMHSLIQQRLDNKEIPANLEEEYSAELKLFDSFQHRILNESGIEIVATEIPVWIGGLGKDEAKSVAGTIDAVGVDEDGRIHLFDWKRCKKIRARVPNKAFGLGCGPARQAENVNLEHYSVQLHLYALCLKQTLQRALQWVALQASAAEAIRGLSIPCDDVRIVNIYPGNSCYQIFKATDHRSTAWAILNDIDRWSCVAIQRRKRTTSSDGADNITEADLPSVAESPQVNASDEVATSSAPSARRDMIIVPYK